MNIVAEIVEIMETVIAEIVDIVETERERKTERQGETETERSCSVGRPYLYLRGIQEDVTYEIR